eukprot:CAMPEP_0117524594 /NCGR_PEP_ID=MMETSP0784-20121206/35327_1 /TAXON_ID=39447 /ORGANISM="" /LENGTH=623 /DNA_ID=CAMNT_0005320749 /DNA_START=59 /DNA_END=1930 /DNA_ORIENTATION=-
MVEEAEEQDEGQQVDGWIPVPASPAAFKSVRLRWRPPPASSLPGADSGGATGEAAPKAEKPYRPKYGPIHRSLCMVELQDLSSTETAPTAVEFRLGDTFGYAEPIGRLRPGDVWRPPKEQERLDVAEWVTEAVLLLEVGQSAEFEPEAAAGGELAQYHVRLLKACPTQDILGDCGVVLQEISPGQEGEKPRDLARVRASWQAWFARNGEHVLSTGDCEATEGVEFVLDESKIMVALEMGLKEMSCGSRAVLRISEAYGCGPLTPSGNPHLKGAAIWLDIKVHHVQNEFAPGQHKTVDEALAFASEKKTQGNASLAAQNAADLGRATRRYEAGVQVLEALLPQGAGSGTSSGNLGPLADDAQRPAVHALMSALQLNLAQAEIKRGRWKDVVALCDAVLQRDAVSPKAHYRRGIARAELSDLDGAVEDLRKAAAANPADAGVRKELARLEALLKEHRAKEKKQFGGVFEKMRLKEQREEEERKKAEELEAEEAKKKKKNQTAAVADMRKRAEIAKAEHGAKAAAAAATESAMGEAAAPAPAQAAAPTAPPPLPQEDLTGSEYTPSSMKVGADDQKLMGKIEEGTATAPMLPQNLKTRVVEAAPPVEYEVPSFLRKKPKRPLSNKA